MRHRYWDACTFLALLRGEEGRLAQCEAAIRHAEKGEIRIITSALTLAEVLWLTGKDPIPVEDREKVRRFFESDFLALYDVDRTIAEMAQDVVWEHRVRPKDAIHVATALSLGRRVSIEQMDTFDVGLQGLSGKIGDPGLVIGEPNFQEGLF